MVNAQVSSLLEDIAGAGTSYFQYELGAREKLLSLAYSLASAVELPSETIQRIGWAEPARLAAMKIAVDLNLFEALKHKSDTGITTAELAKISNADPTLICCTARTMKHLRAMNVVGEIRADHYIATPFSVALTEPSHDIAGLPFYHVPAYLKSISYGHPTNVADGPLQYAHKTASSVFVWLHENPELASCFNNYMRGYRAGKPSWLDPGFYPVAERLGNGIKEGTEEVLLVDVGGGLGHDLELLKQKHLHVPGRLILQDKAEVISQITVPNTVFEKLTHDFFTPQPVHGARAYHLHSILHDWDDASCHAILKNIISAMKKGYSKILINELIVPDQGASWSVTSMDWLMLVLCSTKERTEKDWRVMVEQAGLKVTGIWTQEQGSESVIECELA
ncbi:MAG: hypothetical protein Q9201_003203 [Fulgogasparrea decipioides]